MPRSQVQQPHNMPRYNAVLKKAYTVVDAVIDHIEHTPNGLTWWFNLPHTGQHTRSATRKKLAHLLWHAMMPSSLLHTLLLTALTTDGIVDRRGTPLYAWLLKHVYNNNISKLYEAWFVAVHADVDTQFVDVSDISHTDTQRMAHNISRIPPMTDIMSTDT